MKSILFVVIILSYSLAIADTATLTGSGDIVDAGGNSSSATFNYGSTNPILLSNQNTRFMLIKPISGRVATVIGSGKVITACSLYVYINVNAGDTVSCFIRQCYRKWTPGNANGVAVGTNGDSCNWNKYNAIGGSDNNWQTAGCQGASDRGTPIDTVAITAAEGAGTVKKFDVSAAVAQSWYDGADSSGVILGGSRSVLWSFSATENGTAGVRPALVFYFENATVGGISLSGATTISGAVTLEAQ